MTRNLGTMTTEALEARRDALWEISNHLDKMDSSEAVSYSMDLFMEILEIDKEVERRFEDMMATRKTKVDALRNLNEVRLKNPGGFREWLKSKDYDAMQAYLWNKENGVAK